MLAITVNKKPSSKREGDFIVLTFKDNGTGIDMEQFGRKVFELYERFNDEVPGKGIGLYLIKKQVVGLGGTIHLTSAAGEGTEVVIHIKQED